jgi:hypothetical protein
MKTSTLFVIAMALSSAAQPATGLVADELAVWQAMAETIARDNPKHPYKQLYFQSDFESASNIASSMSDPARNEFCGLSRPDAEAMIGELQAMSTEPIELDASIAEPFGLKLAHKKNPRSRYVAMSRVVFDAGKRRAWLAVDLSGARGGIMWLEKVGAQWNWVSRCGAWVKSQD